MTKRILTLLGLAVIFAFQGSAQAQITITNQPQSITVNNASSAMFTVGAANSSTNALTYQWQLNGTNLTDTGTNMSDPGSISGSTNAILSLENLTSNEAGSYTVVINGSVTSSPPAILTITNGTILTFTFSGLLTNAQSNVMVQLFDHDKPATVQNFLHYVRSGAWSNMFIERCIPGFIVQGGDYDATDHTNTITPATGWDVLNEFITSNNETPPFPFQIASEFYDGPLIKNDFGTLAMALRGNILDQGIPYTGRNGFFFNLIDNSGSPAYFDTTDNGPFTVFGRVIGSGTNVLNYFNSLTNGQGEITNYNFLDNGVSLALAPGFPAFPTLPVDYTGTNDAANANLIFCNFSPTNTPWDTVIPTVSVSSPGANALLTNGPAVVGTASDNVGLADVICTLIPQTTDGIAANAGQSVTNIAFGTTSWAVTNYDLDLDNSQDYYDENGYMLPGTYLLSVQSQDGAGNLSLPATNLITVTGVTTNGSGTVSFLNPGLTNYSPVGYPLQEDGTAYELRATPGSNSAFLNWTGDGTANIYPEIKVYEYDGQLLTATFVATNVPRGTKNIISFTYPPSGAKLQTNSFLMKGKIAASVKSAQIRFQIFSSGLGTAVESGLTTSGTNTWSVPVTNLPPDSYIVEAVATNSAGWSQVVSESFSVLNFKSVGGTYSGLFLCTNGPVAGTNSGFMTFTVGASGVFSGRLVFPAYGTLSFSGANIKFYPNGTFGFTDSAFPGNAFYANLFLDVTGGSDTLTGVVASTTTGSWSSQLICYRGVTKLSEATTPAAGKYVMDLFPGSRTNYPDTNGYASLSAGAGGVLTMNGALPDGATFLQSTRVSKNGVWPLYVTPSGYKTNGTLMGWETNQSPTSFGGQLYWHKKNGVGAYYTSGVNTNITSVGTNYSSATEPAAGSYTIVFQGGSLSGPLTNNLTVARAGGQFKLAAPSDNPDKLAISISARGILTGHFVSPASTKPLQFEGAFFGPTQGGSGFILEGGAQTGSFELR